MPTETTSSVTTLEQMREFGRNVATGTAKIASALKTINDAIGELESPSVMTGATDATGGTAGLVPAPIAGQEEYFLKGNGSWAMIETGTDSGTSNYQQITKTNVTASTSAPKVVDIAIPRTTTFLFGTPNALLFVAGETGVVETACGFDNTDAGDFDYAAKYISFDGTMHLYTAYAINMGTPAALGSGYISTSELIADYKSFEGIAIDQGPAVGIALVAEGGGAGTWAQMEDYVYAADALILANGAAYDFTGALVAADWASLTDAEKISAFDGVGAADTLPATLAGGQALSSFNILLYSSGSTASGCTITAIPQDQLITPNGLISIADYDAINGVTMTASVSGGAAIRYAATPDLSTYYKYNAGSGEWTALAATAEGVLADGMTAAEIAAVPAAAWAALAGENEKLGFAYALSMTSSTDVCYVDAMTLTVNMKGDWRAAIYGTEYTYAYTNNVNLQFKLYASGNWKINYDAGT